jgi:hypothetical protein
MSKLTKKEKLIYSTIDSAINTIPQEGYSDVYDWMNVVFSQVENELEGIIDEDTFDDLRSDYDEYVMSSWVQEDEE